MNQALLQQDLALAVRAYQSRNLNEAEAAATRVLAVRKNEPQATELMGHIRLDQGRFEDAITFFQKALMERPNSAALMNLIGTAYASAKNPKSAMVYYQQAVQAAPDDAMAWENLGKVAYQLRRWSHARAAFDHCLMLNPEHDEATAGLARLAFREGDHNKAMDLASQVIERNPKHLLSRQVMADANLQLGHFEQALKGALAIAEEVHAAPRTKVLAYGIAAEAAQGLKQYDDAFGLFTLMNKAVAQAYQRGYERAQQRGGYRKLQELIELTPSLPAKMKDWPSEDGALPTIYYVGFLSSGMSTFTKIMNRHPQVVSGAKRNDVPYWQEIAWDDDAPARIAALTFDDIARLRREFGVACDEAGIRLREGQVVFDNRPFYTRHIATLAMVLPSAKYLLAHRDPRDVVLECFLRRSSPNVSMYEFLDIETAAHYYDVSMGAAIAARDAFGVDMLELGYDQFWADPEGQTRRVLDHFGLPWNKALRGEDGTLLGGQTKAPSIWRNYEAHLAPVMNILSPWIKRWGYTD